MCYDYESHRWSRTSWGRTKTLPRSRMTGSLRLWWDISSQSRWSWSWLQSCRCWTGSASSPSPHSPWSPPSPSSLPLHTSLSHKDQFVKSDFQKKSGHTSLSHNRHQFVKRTFHLDPNLPSLRVTMKMLASFEAALYPNCNLLTDRVSCVDCRATSVANKSWQATTSDECKHYLSLKIILMTYLATFTSSRGQIFGASIFRSPIYHLIKSEPNLLCQSNSISPQYISKLSF